MNPTRLPQAPYSSAPDAVMVMERRAFIGVIVSTDETLLPE